MLKILINKKHSLVDKRSALKYDINKFVLLDNDSCPIMLVFDSTILDATKRIIKML